MQKRGIALVLTGVAALATVALIFLVRDRAPEIEPDLSTLRLELERSAEQALVPRSLVSTAIELESASPDAEATRLSELARQFDGTAVTREETDATHVLVSIPANKLPEFLAQAAPRAEPAPADPDENALVEFVIRKPAGE